MDGVAFDLTDGKTEAAAGDFFLFDGDAFFFGDPFFVTKSKIFRTVILQLLANLTVTKQLQCIYHTHVILITYFKLNKII